MLPATVHTRLASLRAEPGFAGAQACEMPVEMECASYPPADWIPLPLGCWPGMAAPLWSAPGGSSSAPGARRRPVRAPAARVDAAQEQALRRHHGHERRQRVHVDVAVIVHLRARVCRAPLDPGAFAPFAGLSRSL